MNRDHILRATAEVLREGSETYGVGAVYVLHPANGDDEHADVVDGSFEATVDAVLAAIGHVPDDDRPRCESPIDVGGVIVTCETFDHPFSRIHMRGGASWSEIEQQPADPELFLRMAGVE